MEAQQGVACAVGVFGDSVVVVTVVGVVVVMVFVIVVILILMIIVLCFFPPPRPPASWLLIFWTPGYMRGAVATPQTPSFHWEASVSCWMK